MVESGVGSSSSRRSSESTPFACHITRRPICIIINGAPLIRGLDLNNIYQAIPWLAAEPVTSSGTLIRYPTLNGISTQHAAQELQYGPIGNINRARKDPYRHSANFRQRFNGCPIHEPSARV